MRYTDVTDAAYVDAGHTAIRCMVQFEAFPVPVPFLAMASDIEAHGRQLFGELVAGEHGPIADYTAPEHA